MVAPREDDALLPPSPPWSRNTSPGRSTRREHLTGTSTLLTAPRRRDGTPWPLAALGSTEVAEATGPSLPAFPQLTHKRGGPTAAQEAMEAGGPVAHSKTRGQLQPTEAGGEIRARLQPLSSASGKGERPANALTKMPRGRKRNHLGWRKGRRGLCTEGE